VVGAGSRVAQTGAGRSGVQRPGGPSLVLHVPDGEPPKTIRLDGGPFDKEGAINIILATYSTLTEKYAEAHLKRGGTPSAVYDAKIEKN
jgi:hypothetical protein